MRKMTRNERKTYIQACAARVFKEDDSYTMTDYAHCEDDIEIIPLDLSAYPAITTETAKWMNVLFTEEDTDENGNYMLRGFTFDGPYNEVLKLKLCFGESYNDPYFAWAYNDNEQLIYTYCEGDTTLKPFATKEEYEREKETLEWCNREEET